MESRILCLLLPPLFSGQFPSVSMKDREIEIPVKHDLGILGCRRLCDERRGCVNVRYSPSSLSCSLVFNTYSNVTTRTDAYCRLHFCTQRLLQTRRKGNVTIIKHYEDFFSDKVNGKSESLEQSQDSVGTQLSFVLYKNYSHCYIKGDKKNIIVKRQGLACRVKSTPYFQKGRSYTWTARTLHCGGNADIFQFSISFALPNLKHQITMFQFKRKMGACKYLVPGPNQKKIAVPPDTAFTFLLQNSTLHVFDNINNRSFKTLKLKGKVDESYLNVFISGYCHSKLIFNDINSETC